MVVTALVSFSAGGVALAARANGSGSPDDEVCNVGTGRDDLSILAATLRLPDLAATPNVVPGTVLRTFLPGDRQYRDDFGSVWEILETFVVKDGVFWRVVREYTVSESDVGSTLQMGVFLYLESRCWTGYNIGYTAAVTVVAQLPLSGDPETPSVPDRAPSQEPSTEPSERVKPVRVSVSARKTVKKVTATKPAKVKVKVRRTDGEPPIGRVTVAWGSKKSSAKTVRVKASHWGVVTVNLPKLKPGTYKLRTTFAGTSPLGLRATAKTLKLTIPKKGAPEDS
ncbi:MAG: hypothetical protein LBK59_10245 [Bifidobacteriaceae bacterium]|nr:hypothetical protein [Bifidobacteriaceae bacterium]